MLAEPLSKALDSVNARKKYVIYVTPSGKQLTQKVAQDLSHKDELVFICGRYEGIDQRIIDSYVDLELSIGDYVMSSGEVAATVVIDTVYRLVDGVINHESLEEESYCDGLLEYPQYTHPEEWKGMKVPPVLLSGNHEEIRKWRLKKRLMKTMANRPDLIASARANGQLTEEAEKMIEEICETAKPVQPKKKHRKTAAGD